MNIKGVKFFALLTTIGLLALAAAIYTSYDRHHLSTDLKQTLVEAAYPSNTFDQIDAYLHEARLQIRTQKDREVYGKFYEAVRIAENIETPPQSKNSEESEQEAKNLYTEVRGDLGLTQFKSIYLPLFK